jgi:hypothetical protein
MDQGKLVCERRGLSRVKYAVQMAKRDAGSLTSLAGGLTVDYIEAGGLTPLCGVQTMNIAVAGGLTPLCGGLTTRGSLNPLYF